jgi:hypothetical protein
MPGTFPAAVQPVVVVRGNRRGVPGGHKPALAHSFGLHIV